MNNNRLVALAVMVFFWASQELLADVYITISGAKVQKARLFLSSMHPNGTVGIPPSSINELSEQLRQNIDFMGVFERVEGPSSKVFDAPDRGHLAKQPEMVEMGIRFALTLAHSSSGGKWSIDATFYDVPGNKKIFSKTYRSASQRGFEMIRGLSEDVLEMTTGERGLFSTRVAMVCQTRIKTKNPHKEVYLVDSDSRNFNQLTRDKTISVSPSWSPDGKSLTYTQYEWIVSKGRRIKGTVLKRHFLDTGRRQPISAKEGMNSGAAWSPDGKRIAATLSYTGRPEVYLIDPQQPATPEPLSRNIKWQRIGGGFHSADVNLLFEVEPSWSPDGKNIVLSSARNRHPMIYVVNMQSFVARQLTFAGIYNASPAWSPRGDKIIFAAQRLEEGNFDLFLIDPDGNNLQRVTVGDRPGRKVNSENPSWARTGRHFVYASNEDGAYAIYAMTTDGLVRKRLSPPGLACSNPSWESSLPIAK